MPTSLPVRVAATSAALPSRVSPSQVGTWRDCPLRYFFASILRWREPATVATTVGTLVHDTAERLYQLPARDRTPATATALLREDAARRFTEHEYQPFKTNLEVFQRANNAVTNMFTVETPFELEVELADLEQELTPVVDGVAFIGRLDRRTRGAVSRISDYKSGRRPAAPYLPGKLSQLYLYAAAAEADSDPAEEVELLFLADGVRVRRPVYPAAVHAARNLLSGMRQASERALSESTFTATPGPLCRFCAFASACPAKRSNAPLPGTSDSDEILRGRGLQQRLSTPAAPADTVGELEDVLDVRDVDADADWTP